jgi:multidrug efflux pump subunit AcrA (membrane-fusion protein)
MIKYYYYISLIYFLFLSCTDKKENKQLTVNKAIQEYTINQVVGIGIIVPERNIIQLSSPVNGIIKKIYKNENDIVNIGTVILELEHELEDEHVIKLTREVATQLAKVQVELASVNELSAKVMNTKTKLKRLQSLLAKGAETQQVVDDERTELRTLNSNIDKLQANVFVSRNRIKEAKANLKIAQLEREQKRIKSVTNGRILELSVLIGGSVTMQQSLAQISPDGNVIAQCEIDELYADKIKVGQRGWIRNVGSVDTLSTGRIISAFVFLKKKSLFTDQAGEKEDRRVRTIKMMLDNSSKLLLNSRVECVINIATKINK